MSVTVVLLNYKRQANLPRLIDSIVRQTVAPKIFLWNNGQPYTDSRIDWQVNSSVNKKCWPRWYMASMADTEFICTMDDDWMFGDERVLQDAIEKSFQVGNIIGPLGVQVGIHAKNYRKCRHIHMPSIDMPVDIVKGRLMFMRRKLLNSVPINVDNPREDDIYISCATTRHSPPHIVPSLFTGRMIELPTHGTGLEFERIHYLSRTRAVRRYFLEEDMQTFVFSLKLDVDELTEELCEKIYKSCDDATLCEKNQVSIAHFDREAASKEEAVKSAIDGLAKLGIKAELEYE